MTINELKDKLLERKRDWTDLAQGAEISRKTIERIAFGKTDPRVSTVEKLAELLTN